MQAPNVLAPSQSCENLYLSVLMVPLLSSRSRYSAANIRTHHSWRAISDRPEHWDGRVAPAFPLLWHPVRATGHNQSIRSPGTTRHRLSHIKTRDSRRLRCAHFAVVCALIALSACFIPPSVTFFKQLGSLDLNSLSSSSHISFAALPTRFPSSFEPFAVLRSRSA